MLTARIGAHPPERRELVQALVGWAAAARLDAGVVAAHVYEDVEIPATFCLEAHYESRRALEAHVCGPAFGVVLGALELLAQPPAASIVELGEDHSGDALRTIKRLRDTGRAAAPGPASRGLTGTGAQ